MTAPDQGAFKLENPWPRIGWASLAGLIVISAVLGFVVLSRYQQNDQALDIWGQSAAASASPPTGDRQRSQNRPCARRRRSPGPAARSTRLLPATRSMARSSH